MSEIDAILLVLSAPSISAKALRRIASEALKASDLPTRFVRLEEEGPSLFDALDELRDEHCCAIRIQPIGFPFPENMMTWLPSVLASWGERAENDSVRLILGADSGKDPALIQRLIGQILAQSEPGQDVKSVVPSLGKPGWNMPPDYDFHLLVCVGPRCQIHGSTPFLQLLQKEVRNAGLQKRCLITRTGCIYPCNKGPVLALYPHGDWYRLPDESSINRFVHEALLQGKRLPEFIFHRARLANTLTASKPPQNVMEINKCK